MLSGLPPKADFPILETTPAASFSRTPPSLSRASPRSRALACGPRGAEGKRPLDGREAEARLRIRDDMFQGRLAENPEKAHTRDAPRINTTSGMPNAMLAHVPSVTHGFGRSRIGTPCSA
jgi:hypothetical protein